MYERYGEGRATPKPVWCVSPGGRYSWVRVRVRVRVRAVAGAGAGAGAGADGRARARAVRPRVALRGLPHRHHVHPRR
ncbi:hypothetical protein STRAU_3724 [Streptomyces aurantiacus JA 4570]|uniref:Uncharacterized protein n=1 Tax=Streptomyces aurantiacus JA 4570 TaxID=1286094 RepID=S3ZKA3_9ACTN|nr:hypothetical protein STRAU_3724 [Streptomyces aurantiacus JA 4570]